MMMLGAKTEKARSWSRRRLGSTTVKQKHRPLRKGEKMRKITTSGLPVGTTMIPPRKGHLLGRKGVNHRRLTDMDHGLVYIAHP